MEDEMSFDYTFFTICVGTAILGFVSGALGCFAVLRKQSLLGDAISHASLPGVALVFLLFLSKNPLLLTIGAIIAGWIGTLLVMVIVKNTVIKEDSALGIILSVFFGFGLVLLTIIQKHPTANQAGLSKYLFGNASTLLKEDIYIMIYFGSAVLLLLLLFWKEFKILSFDSGFAKSLGYPVKRIEVLLTTLIVVAIVIGLQAVGVVLMSAMIIAPAVAARLWTDKLGVMVLLSALFGSISGVMGAIASASIPKLPTGPSIVLVVSFIVFFSLFFSPQRGLVWEWIRNARSN
jgi:manganese/zinc/iron transport system permease protein